MFGTRTRKIIRDITARRTRTALVTLSVFVGVLGVVVLATAGQIVSRQLEQDLLPGEMAMLRVFVDAPPRSTIDNAAVLERLRQYPGVTVVEGQAVYEFGWKLPGETEFRTGELYAYSEPFGQIQLEPIRLVAGRFPVAGQGEIAIERRMADRHGLHLGDTLVVGLNGRGEQPMQIVGLVCQPYVYIGGGDGTASAYAAYADAQRIVRFTGFSSIYVRFQDFATARQESHAFRRALMNQTPYTIVFYVVSDPQNNLILVGVRQFTRVLLLLALVALTVASVLVTTVISTIVAEQRQQIGAMKALGATRWDILRMYLGMAFVYGLLGTVPALVLGVPLGQQVALATAPLANTVLEDITPPLAALLMAAGLGLGVPVLAAAVPVYSGARVTIYEAMTDQGIPATYGKGPLARLVARLRLPLTLIQALNNVLRHKSRLALTLFTLALAVAAFMGVFAVFEILDDVVGKFQTTLNYQISVDPASINVRDLMQSLLTEEQIREIKPGVAVQLAIELDGAGSAPAPGDGSAVEPELQTLFVAGIDTTSDLLHVVLVEGTAWLDDPARPGVVITPRMAEDLGKTVGDTLRLVSPQTTADFEIIGVAEFPLETVFMEWQQLADFVGIIRDAPIPNAYWARLQIELDDGEDPFEETGVWALGVDEAIGRLLAPGFDATHPGVIVSETLAQGIGLQEGDTLVLRPYDVSLLDTLVEEIARPYPVLKIMRLRPYELAVVARDLPPDIAVDRPVLLAMPWAELADLVRLDYNEISPETFLINMQNPEETAEARNHTLEPPAPVFQNQGAFEERIAQTILSLGLVMGVAASLMAVVGGIGLLVITSIGVFERQREIGVMRSVGASSRIILLQFLAEGLVIGAIAWAIGLPLSYGLSRLLIASVPFSEVIAFRYTLLAPVIGLAGMLLVTGAATLYPSIVATRKTVSDILRYQ